MRLRLPALTAVSLALAPWVMSVHVFAQTQAEGGSPSLPPLPEPVAPEVSTPPPTSIPVPISTIPPSTPAQPPTSPSTTTLPPTFVTLVPRPDRPFFRVAVQTEGAIGVSGPFYNHLVGARLDRCFTSTTCLGAYGAYANLKGQAGRASNVLLYALLERRVSLGSGWSLPLRAATGYLPRNGPFARLSAGLGLRSGSYDFTLDLLAPSLWVTGDEPVVSLDLAAEAALSF